MNEAVDKGLLPANPATRLGRLTKQAPKVHEDADPFTAEEIPDLLETALQQYGRDNYVIMLTALHTGMRSSEIAGLQWADVDFRNRFLIVRRQYKGGVVRKTKQQKSRKVDISDALLTELQALKKRRREEYLGRGKNEIPEWVSLSPGLRQKDGKREEGQPLDMKNWCNRIFAKVLDQLQIRQRGIHQTRHTFATILLMAGESPVYVKEQLGHSSINVTVDIYGHWIPGANRQAVNKLPSIGTPTLTAKAATNKS